MFSRNETFNYTMDLNEIEYKSGESRLVLFLRPEESSASVFIAVGTQKDIVAMVSQFRQDYPSFFHLKNQVSHEHELRAMYKAGLRAKDDSDCELKLDFALIRLKNRSSVYLERKFA